MNPDVVIVGAGAAGLFAALELSEKSSLKILVVDCGDAPAKRFCPEQSYKGCTICSPCHILCGVGGAGTLSSGRLNLKPDVGGNLYTLTGDEKKAWDLVRHVEKHFLKYVSYI